MGYNLRKRPEMAENTSFSDPYRVVYRGSQGIEILMDLKIMGYNPRKRLEIAENMNLPISLELCTGGHGGSKSSRD